MFEDSMIESQKVLQTSHRGQATILSFALQVVVIGALVLIPLFATHAIPTPELTTQLVAPPPPPPPPPPAASQSRPTPVEHSAAVQPLKPNEIRTPSKIPQKIEMAKAEPAAAPPSIGGVVGGVPGGVSGGQLGGVLGGVLGAAPSNVPAMAASKRVKVSQGVAQGLLVHRVVPQYPPIARQAHVQGAVVLQALISKNGMIENVQVLSGPPQLASAAVQAVKQWRYKPYYLNGQPVEVQTMINVNFNLGGEAS
jgi:protein TonB